jgi:hypothetical protein
MRLVIATLGCLALWAPRTHAQVIVNPERLSAAMRSLERQPDDRPLSCSVEEIKPYLNFGFRFQTGYVVHVPMGQYEGKGHRWAILARVTPDGGKPVYFLSRRVLPDVPKTKQQLETGGGFLVGEGRYHVDWKLQDDTGRVCRKQWNFEARLTRSEGKVTVSMPPNTADSFGNWTVSARPATDDAAPIRLTVLMHAAPGSPRRTRMGARDRFLLLGTLETLFERLPTSSVRLVIFNLDGQKEIYRQESFQAADFGQVERALDSLETGLVDYRVLQNQRGHVDLLADLVNQEMNARPPSDVVLFLGPMSRFFERMPDTAIDRPSGGTPRFFYFQYRPPSMRMEATLPDLIHSAVSKLKGKTVIIHTPGDFAKGIYQVEHPK